MDYFKKAVKDIQPALKFFEKKSKEAINEIETKLGTNKKPVDQTLVPISNRIYWMPYPEKSTLGNLANYLNETFDSNYFIWNISEHKYEVFPFNNQVAEHNCPGYPSPPLSELFLICKSILSWLEMDQNNVAIIHCQNTRGRSALLISCLLCLTKEYMHPGEALTYFCKQTRTKDQKILFPSQQLYLNYFANIMNGLKLNTRPAKIVRVVFSEVPKMIKKMGKNSDNQFRPYIQMFKGNKNIYNSLNENKIVSYTDNDISIWFDMQGIELKEDGLLRCKHYESNEKRVPVFRTMIHTNFIHDNVLRLLKKDIDFTQNVEVSENFFMDILFCDPNQKKNKKKQQQQKKQDDEDDDYEDEDQENEKQDNENEEEEEQKSEVEDQKKNNQDEATSLEYIVKQVKQQFNVEEPSVHPAINKFQLSELKMQMSRESSATSDTEDYSNKNSPLKNKFAIIDDNTVLKKNSEDISIQDSGQKAEQVKKDQKLDKFFNELDKDDELGENEDEEDMDDYLARLESENN